METLKKLAVNITTIMIIIAILLFYNHTHTLYLHSEYPVTYTQYLMNGWWFQEPTDAELDPTSDGYIGF